MNDIAAVDIVKSFVAHLSSGNMESVVSLFADDGAIDMPATTLPWAGRLAREEIKRYFEVMPAALDIRGATQSRWICQENLVSVSGTEHGVSRKSGKDYQAKWSWTFAVGRRKIKLWDAYEHAEAMFNCGSWR